MTVPFKPKQRLLFIGDSITDTGRVRPVGRRAQDGLGTGYESIIRTWLKQTRLNLKGLVLMTPFFLASNRSAAIK